MRAKGLERRDKVLGKVMRNDGYRMWDEECGMRNVGWIGEVRDER